MGIFSLAKEQNELVLVFDIGSSSVGAALFRTQVSGIPKIIFSTKESIHLEEKVDIDRLLFLTIKALETVVSRVFHAKKGAPSNFFCILSSPWHISQARIINFKKNTPFVFSAKLADELVQKEISIFEEEHLVKYKNTNNALRTIDLKNIKTILNGYETSKPLNQKIKELEMTVFISVSAESLLKKIESTIAKHFNFNKIKFSSFTMASFAVVRDMYVPHENFLLVNIGGEVTDISMVKKSILRESITFPLGRNFLIRGVALDLGCTLNEAHSLISLYNVGHADQQVDKKLSAVLGKLRIEWLKEFQQSLADLSNDISIPATVYIAMDKDIVDFFSETIKLEQFNQYTLTESKFEIIFLSTELLHGGALFEESVIREPFLIIDSIFINHFLIKK